MELRPDEQPLGLGTWPTPWGSGLQLGSQKTDGFRGRDSLEFG